MNWLYFCLLANFWLLGALFILFTCNVIISFLGHCFCCSVTQSCPALCNLMDYSMPGFPVLHYLHEFAQTQAHWISDLLKHLILCCPLLLPSVFPSIKVFSNKLALHIRWPKYWSFSFSISPSNKYSGLISFRIDWFDLLVVQETLESLLQHHGSKASIPPHSAFFMVQLSHLYMTTGKTILQLYKHLSAKWCLCFYNTLSRFVIALLPRRKCLSVSWLQSLTAVILELKKENLLLLLLAPLHLPWVMAMDALILFFEFHWSFEIIRSLLSFKPASSFSSLSLNRGSSVPLQFLSLEWYYLYIWRYWFSPGNLDSSLWVIQPGISHDVLCI